MGSGGGRRGEDMSMLWRGAAASETSAGLDAAVEKALVFLSAAFLFAGLYKGSIPAPFDWTILSGGAATALLMLANRQRPADAVPVLATACFALTVAYLALRTSDDSAHPFGAAKLAESILLGYPALLLGYHIARRPESFRFFGQLLLIVAAGVALYTIVTALAADNITSSNPFLAAGYQLSGNLMAIAVLAAFVQLSGEKWMWPAIAVVVCVVGIAFTGSVPSFLFLFITVVVLVALHAVIRHRLDWMRRTAGALAAGLVVVGIFSAAFDPPASIYRLVWKAQVELQEAGLTLPGFIQDEIGAGSSGSADIVGRFFGDAVDMLPQEEHENYVNRVELAEAAWAGFLEAPLFGNGFGSFMHKDTRTEHNIVLELMNEGGLVGLALFAMFLAACLLHVPQALSASRSHPARTKPLLFAALGIMIFAFALQLVGGYFIGRILTFSLGLVLGVSVLATQKRAASETCSQ